MAHGAVCEVAPVTERYKECSVLFCKEPPKVVLGVGGSGRNPCVSLSRLPLCSAHAKTLALGIDKALMNPEFEDVCDECNRVVHKDSLQPDPVEPEFRRCEACY